MSTMVLVGLYLCSKSHGACDMMNNNGQPAIYEDMQGCQFVISQMGRPDEGYYECRAFNYEDVVPAPPLPEHVPLTPIK